MRIKIFLLLLINCLIFNVLAYNYGDKELINKNIGLIDKILSINKEAIEKITGEKIENFAIEHFNMFEKKEYVGERYYIVFNDKNNQEYSLTADLNGLIFSFDKNFDDYNEDIRIVDKEEIIKNVWQYIEIFRKDHVKSRFKLTSIISMPDIDPKRYYWNLIFHKYTGKYYLGEYFSIDFFKDGEFKGFYTIYNGVDYKYSGKMKILREDALDIAYDFLTKKLYFKLSDIKLEEIDDVSNTIYFKGLNNKNPIYAYRNNFKYKMTNPIYYYMKEFSNKYFPKEKESRLSWAFSFDIRGYSGWVMTLVIDCETGEIIGGF